MTDEQSIDGIRDSLTAGDTSYDSNFYAKGDTMERRKTVQRLSQIPALPVEEINEMANWTPEQREAEIKRCESLTKRYKILMYMVSSNSGWFQFSDLVTFYFLHHTLEQSFDNISKINSYIAFPWMIKPLFGFLSDSFFPFKFRFKSHISILCLIHALSALYLFLFGCATPGVFTVIFLLMNLSVAYVDTMAEGISSVITKLDEKIQGLKAIGHNFEDEEDTSMRAFGNYSSIRAIFRALMSFIGGIFAKGISINLAGLILGIYPIIMLLFTIFFFKEDRKKKFFNGVGHFVVGFKQTIKVLLKPFNFKPFVLLILFYIPPGFGSMFRLLYLGRVGFSYVSLSANSFIFSMISSFGFMYFVNKVKNADFSKLILWGAILSTLNFFFSFGYFFMRGMPLYIPFIFKIFNDLIGGFGGNILSTPVIGQISKYLPEGLESTGITIVIAFMNFAGITNGWLSGVQSELYNAEEPGFYERSFKPLMINLGFQIGLIFIAPFFLSKIKPPKVIKK